MTKVLRAVPTFDQLVNLPVPQLTPPERAIEVGRPDPNVFDQHEGLMGQQRNLMHMHAMLTGLLSSSAAIARSCIARRLLWLQQLCGFAHFAQEPPPIMVNAPSY